MINIQVQLAWGLHACRQHAIVIVNFSTWRGFQYLQTSSKTLLCISLDGETAPCPKAALDRLFLPGLVSPPFPS